MPRLKPKKKTRRPNHEGSLKELPDGRWQVRVTVGYRDGDSKRPIQRSATTQSRDKKEAMELLQRLRLEHGQGQRAAQGGLLVRDYLESYLEWRHKSPDLEDDTKRLHRYLATFPTEAFGNLELSALRVEHVEQLYADMAARGLSKSLVDHTHHLLNAALRRAERNEWVVRNVARLADRPAMKSSPRARPLTDEEQDKLLEVLWGHGISILVYLGLAAGFRPGELRGLRWQDLTVHRDGETVWGELRLQRQVTQRRVVKDKLKTRNAYRTIALNSEAVGVLLAHRQRQADQGLGDTPWICADANGNPPAARNLLRKWHNVLAAAGIIPPKPRKPRGKPRPKWEKGHKIPRLHDLRHTFATEMASRVERPKDLAALLGHSDSRISIQIYTHAKGSDVERVMRERPPLMKPKGATRDLLEAPTKTLEPRARSVRKKRAGTG